MDQIACLRRAAQIARADARSRGLDVVAGDSVLVALLRLDPGLLDVRIAAVRAAAEDVLPHGTASLSRSVPFSAAVRRAFDRAGTYAYARGQASVEPVHLLLSLVDHDDGSAGAVLAALAVDVASLQERLAEAAGPVVSARTG